MSCGAVPTYTGASGAFPSDVLNTLMQLFALPFWVGSLTHLYAPMRVSAASAALLDAVNEIKIAVPGKQAREDVEQLGRGLLARRHRHHGGRLLAHHGHRHGPARERVRQLDVRGYASRSPEIKYY